MKEELIRHLGRGKHAYILANGEAEITIEVGKADVKAIYLIYYDKYLRDYGPEFKEIELPMIFMGSGRFSDFYRVRVKPLRARLHYFFRIVFNSGENKYFNATGLSDRPVFNEFDLFAIPYLNLEDSIATPAWAKGAVMYQIFPDTFNSLEGLNESPEGEYPSIRFAGGTLNGIKDKIPYLKDLGIDVIYLTPIFKSHTNHRYDTIDYMEIDPRLGTKDDLRALVDELHMNNMRIVLDGVFNHSSSYFFAFQDIIENQEKSKYKDWYHILKYPVLRNHNDKLNLNYETWSVTVDMPKLNTCNPEVMEYIFKSISYWTMEFNIDGWRLDVANEVPIYFWRKFKELMKGINKDILLIGESWNDSSAYLDGTSFDSVMNYLFRAYLFKLASNSKSDPIGAINKFIEQYVEHTIMYPSPHFDALINLISSHDVERLVENYNFKEIRALVAIQMTLGGLPCIYYGDEIGLATSRVLSNRAIMDWSKANNETHAYFKELISLRHKYTALASSRVEFINKQNGVLEYLKYDGNARARVMISFSKDKIVLEDNSGVIYKTSIDDTLNYLDIIIYSLN